MRGNLISTPNPILTATTFLSIVTAPGEDLRFSDFKFLTAHLGKAKHSQ